MKNALSGGNVLVTIIGMMVKVNVYNRLLKEPWRFFKKLNNFSTFVVVWLLACAL
jgi:hypothetical protein